MLFVQIQKKIELPKIESPTLQSNTVYRTEQVHPELGFKGKSVWGKGKYFSLNKDQAASYTLPFDDYQNVKEGIRKLENKDYSKVDSYSIDPKAKIKVIDLTKNYAEDIPEWTMTSTQIKNKTLKDGYDGLKIIGGSDNVGGNQIVIYNDNMVHIKK